MAPSRGEAPRRSVSRPSHGLRHSQDTRLVHFTWPCRRRRWMFSKQQANALERSCSTGRGCRITLGPPAGGVLWSCTRRDERRVGRASGGKISGRISASAEPGADWRRARCAPRARGLPSRPVASSQAREDCTRPPCWRAIARIVLSRRGRPVSRVGQKKGKSTTCEPSTLRRGAWSRPPRRQRSACTSSPRRARTRHRKCGC